MGSIIHGKLNNMEYKGMLYGKVGKSLIPLMNTTEDVEELISQLRHVTNALKAVNSMGATKSIIERSEQTLKKFE